MSDHVYRFDIGAFRCLAVRDASATYTIGEWFVDVSEDQVAAALQESGFPAAAVPVDSNCLFIDAGAERILVDVGWGLAGQRKQGALVSHLHSGGITPEEITAIVITHNDGDHVSGVLDRDDNPVFPNARYIMWQAGWDAWSALDWSQMPDPVAVFGRRLVAVVGERIVPVAAETDFLPGFRLIPATGHRPTHTALTISSQGAHLLHLADAVGHPILIPHPEWRWVHHSAPVRAADDMRRLCEWAASHQARIFGAHFPFPGLGRVARDGAGWSWQPVDAQGS